MKTKLDFVAMYRVDTLEEVEQLHEDMKAEALEKGYELKGFTWTKKEKKKKGAILDEGFLVKVTKHYSDFFFSGLEG